MRKAISRKRCSRTVRSYSIVSKISRSGRKVMLVPRRSVFVALLEPGRRRAALVRLRVLVAVAPDREVQPLGQRVDDRHADAVQAAGDLVAAAVAELAAGVEHGEDDLGGGLLLLGHRVDGDAAAVVRDRDGVVRVDDDLDLVGLAGEGLVDGVVDDLVDQVMEAAGAGRADVHARALADRLETLQDGDVLSVVAAVALAGGAGVALGAIRLAGVAPAARAVLLVPIVLRLLRQSVPSVQTGSLVRARPLHTMKNPGTGRATYGPGRYIRPPRILAGDPHSRSRSESYKMPANRNKTSAVSDGSHPNRR